MGFPTLGVLRCLLESPASSDSYPRADSSCSLPPPQGITADLPFVKVVDNFDAQYEYVDNEGTRFLFKTNLGAPRYKVVTVDLGGKAAVPPPSEWLTLVPEAPARAGGGGDVLEWVAPLKHDTLVVCGLRDVKHELEIRREGIEAEIGARAPRGGLCDLSLLRRDLQPTVLPDV